MDKARKLARLLRDPFYRRALRHGVAAAIEHEAVPFVHPFRSVIDAGAGRGQFALLAARRFPGASIHCFEPLSTSRHRLVRALGRDVPYTLQPIALGAASTELDLHVSRRADSTSLLAMTATQTSAYPGTEVVGRERTTVMRLDDVLDPGSLEPPCLLKIDVQGYELELLRGAPQTLDHVAEVLVECSFVELYDGQPLAHDVICFLCARRFSLVGLSSLARDSRGRLLQADLQFLRSGPT